ncbi:MAG: hypothetical protein PHO66_03105 [Eubacteriales bacterium]|nr:hypothetical protein [Eubacteriales bacterium]
MKGGQGHHIHIALPTVMVCNSMTAMMVSAASRKRGECTLSAAQMRRLFRAVHQARRQYPGLKLVQVVGRDGKRVEISL